MAGLKETVRKVAHYLRTDFKEIVNPSAMPNPEWYKASSTRKPTLGEFVKVSLSLLGGVSVGALSPSSLPVMPRSCAH